MARSIFTTTRCGGSRRREVADSVVKDDKSVHPLIHDVGMHVRWATHPNVMNSGAPKTPLSTRFLRCSPHGFNSQTWLMHLRAKLSFATLALVFWLPATATLQADQEGANRVHVTAGQFGGYYAKSVPFESYGLKGVTKIYQAQADEDRLVQSFDWYSPQIALIGLPANGGTVYVVQLGPWHRGREARAEHHAIAFYKNGTLVKAYSTLEIAGSPDNVSASTGHYRVFSKLIGFRRPFGNQFIFDIERVESNRRRVLPVRPDQEVSQEQPPVILSFDTETGLLITKEEEALKKLLFDAESAIASIKFKWYQAQKDTIPDIKEVLITEEILRETAAGELPVLPEGYKYVAGKIWDPVKFEKE